MIQQPTKPFLRWAGGKTWLIKHLPSLLPPSGFNTYHEPFLGGASVFLHLNLKKAFLSDLNEELINTYRCIKDHFGELIIHLQSLNNTEEDYYRVRALVTTDPVIKAAVFIYLNQTSFNGIYRVNLKGVYNVPYGYRSKEVFNLSALENVRAKLQKVELNSGDFQLIKNNVKKDDLVFLDPPYTVSHNLNGFIKYNQKLFSLEDQYRLSTLIDYIKSKGAFYILTNAAHHKITEIFDKGDFKIELSRANLIGGINAKRGQTSEYIFTNCVNKVI